MLDERFDGGVLAQVERGMAVASGRGVLLVHGGDVVEVWAEKDMADDGFELHYVFVGAVGVVELGEGVMYHMFHRGNCPTCHTELKLKVDIEVVTPTIQYQPTTGQMIPYAVCKKCKNWTGDLTMDVYKVTALRFCGFCGEKL